MSEVAAPVIKLVNNQQGEQHYAPTNNEPSTPPEPPAPKMWDDEWKANFADEDVETVKSYKTKATELEPKVAEYETQIESLRKENEKYNKHEKLKMYADILDSGKDFTPETIAFLNTDFTKVKDKLDGLGKAMKEANPDWDEKKIQFELKSKYRLNEFKGIPDEDLTEEEREIKEVMEADMERDWNKEAARLTAKQDEFKLIKTATPEEIEAASKSEEAKGLAKEKAEKELETNLKKISAKVDKLTINFPKETQDKFAKLMGGVKEEVTPYEFEVDVKDKEKASEILTSVGKDLNKFWDMFKEKDENGSLQWTENAMAKVYDVILYLTTGEKMKQELAVSQFSKGLEFAVRNDSNINFKANNTQSAQGNKGVLKLVKNQQQ